MPIQQAFFGLSRLSGRHRYNKRRWYQSRSHFLRQANGRLQTGQILVGKLAFLRIFIGL